MRNNFKSVLLSSLLIISTSCNSNTNTSTSSFSSSVESSSVEEEKVEEAKTYYSYEDIVKRTYDKKWLASKNYTNERTYQWSSADARAYYDEENDTYVGWDANWDGNIIHKSLDNQEEVCIDVSGAGYISRLWCGDIHKGANIRIYIDNKLVIDQDILEFFTNINSNTFENIDDPKTLYGLGFTSNHDYEQLTHITNKGPNFYIPLTFNESCTIQYINENNSGLWWFKQIEYTLFDEGVEVEPFNGFDNLSTTNKNALKKANDALKESEDNITSNEGYYLKPKSSKVIYNDESYGAISKIKAKVLNALDDDSLKQAYKDLSFNVYYDGKDYPDISLSFADFFGVVSGNIEYSTTAIGSLDDATLYANWYMPYEKCKIELVNNSENEYYTHIDFEHESLNKAKVAKLNRFVARYKYLEDGDINSDRFPDSLGLDAYGSGRLVAFTYHSNQMYTLMCWYNEGEEKIFVDDEKTPSWQGTGSEDTIGYCYGISTPYSSAFRSHHSNNTASFYDPKENQDVAILQAASIPFSKHIEFYDEKNISSDNVYIGMVAYYYLDANDLNDSRNKIDHLYDEEERNYYFPVHMEDTIVQPVQRYEAERFDYYAKQNATGGSPCVQYAGSPYSGYHKLFWEKVSDGSTIEELKLPFSVSEDGDYDIISGLNLSFDFGIFDIYVDDTYLDTANLYSASVDIEQRKHGTIHLSKGSHYIKYVFAGHDDRVWTASGYYHFALDYFQIVKKNSIYMEADDLMNQGYQNTGGDFYWSVAYNDFVSGMCRMLWENQLPNGTFEFDLDVETSGVYDIQVSLGKVYDAGKVQILIDGVEVGDVIDCYHAAEKGTGALDLETMYLSKGTHKITYKVVGKNSKSSGYKVYFDYMHFIWEE